MRLLDLKNKIEFFKDNQENDNVVIKENMLNKILIDKIIEICNEAIEKGNVYLKVHNKIIDSGEFKKQFSSEDIEDEIKTFEWYYSKHDPMETRENDLILRNELVDRLNSEFLKQGMKKSDGLLELEIWIDKYLLGQLFEFYDLDYIQDLCDDATANETYLYGPPYDLVVEMKERILEAYDKIEKEMIKEQWVVDIDAE